MADYKNFRLPKTEKNTLAKSLELHRKNLGRLRDKLNGYAGKSTSIDLYKHIAVLQDDLERLKTDNDGIIIAIKEQPLLEGATKECIATYFSEFHKLSRCIKEYVQGVSVEKYHGDFAEEATLEMPNSIGGSPQLHLWGKVTTGLNSLFF